MTADARRMPRRGILRITWTTMLASNSRGSLSPLPLRKMTKLLKVRPAPRAGGRARTVMSMFGVSGPKADGVYAELAKTYGVGSYFAARLLK